MLSPTGLLTDNIIDAAQMLLKQAFPALSGLQSVTCGLTMNFDIEPAEFVQILHNGQGYWLTILTIGTSHPDIHVYDSIYPSAGTLVKAQTAALLHTESPAICLKFMRVQMQAGGYDCGLFAVAFVVALAFGNQLEVSFTSSNRKCGTTCGNVSRTGKSTCFPITSYNELPN